MADLLLGRRGDVAVGAEQVVGVVPLFDLDQAVEALPDEPAVDLPKRVRPVLSILLETGAPRVIVNDEGEPVGYLDLPAIQAVSIPQVVGNES